VTVQNTAYVANAQAPIAASSNFKASSRLSQDDDFLCGKIGWILCAIVGLILLTLALLFGLGAFGGNNGNGASLTNISASLPTI
jgi:hypothetical protein